MGLSNTVRFASPLCGVPCLLRDTWCEQEEEGEEEVGLAWRGACMVLRVVANAAQLPVGFWYSSSQALAGLRIIVVKIGTCDGSKLLTKVRIGSDEFGKGICYHVLSPDREKHKVAVASVLKLPEYSMSQGLSHSILAINGMID
eukprot:742144-Pelagomonas_calceolata.AAC.1